MGSLNGVGDLVKFLQAFPKVKLRHHVAPSEDLPKGDGFLDASNSTVTWPMQMIGRKDGENAVKNGEGYMWRQMDKWNDSAELKELFPKLEDYISFIVEERAGFHNEETEKKFEIPIMMIKYLIKYIK